jgi:hypothetical protein
MSEFHNIVPKGRAARASKVDKHAYERQRLAERREGFQRNDPETNPLYISENAIGYLEENERFHTDIAAEEKAIRDNNLQRKQHIIEAKRQAHINRETNRLERMESEAKKEEIKWEHKRKSENARKNKSSVKYDLVTLESKNEKDREDEQYKRNFAHYSGAIRANRLFQKDSCVEYNLLTGEPRVVPEIVQLKTNSSTGEH